MRLPETLRDVRQDMSSRPGKDLEYDKLYPVRAQFISTEYSSSTQGNMST